MIYCFGTLPTIHVYCSQFAMGTNNANYYLCVLQQCLCVLAFYLAAAKEMQKNILLFLFLMSSASQTLPMCCSYTQGTVFVPGTLPTQTLYLLGTYNHSHLIIM